MDRFDVLDACDYVLSRANINDIHIVGNNAYRIDENNNLVPANLTQEQVSIYNSIKIIKSFVEKG